MVVKIIKCNETYKQPYLAWGEYKFFITHIEHINLLNIDKIKDKVY